MSASKPEPLKTITVTRNTAAAGQHLAAGTVLAVGTDVSEADARALLDARKAAPGGEKKTRKPRQARTGTDSLDAGNGTDTTAAGDGDDTLDAGTGTDTVGGDGTATA